jgi:hypothetical protein
MAKPVFHASPCDRLAPRGAARPETQQRIAARAFELWLARSFRHGSPQEDWLQAQRDVLQWGTEAFGRRYSDHQIQ